MGCHCNSVSLVLRAEGCPELHSSQLNAIFKSFWFLRAAVDCPLSIIQLHILSSPAFQIRPASPLRSEKQHHLHQRDLRVAGDAVLDGRHL